MPQNDLNCPSRARRQRLILALGLAFAVGANNTGCRSSGVALAQRSSVSTVRHSDTESSQSVEQCVDQRMPLAAATAAVDAKDEVHVVAFQEAASESLLKPVVQGTIEPLSTVQGETEQPQITNAIGDVVTLQDVVASVRVAFPSIRAAIARQDEASGTIVSAWGSFDNVLDGHTINQPLGYYENYRHGVGLKKPLWNGGYLATGYRIGDGEFEPWYGERETDEGGEFKLGMDVPLLQGRAIDKRRTELRSASLRRGQTDPELYLEILNAQAAAAISYWGWVAAGQGVQVQQRLITLARVRAEQLDARIKAGDAAEFTRIDNDRLIAGREIKLIDAQRKLGETAVKLSLYYRDVQAQPIVLPPSSVPNDFPAIEPMAVDEDQQIAIALGARPELQVLQFEGARTRVELEQAINQLLPTVNLAVETSQDVGAKASSKGDKQPAKIEAGVYGEVPLQRRFARGKIDTLRAKLRQIDAKTQLTGDKIATEVQQILVARAAALSQIEQAEINVELAEKTLAAGTVGLREGEFTLPVLNIYEQALADAEGALILARAEYFIADALLSIATAREL